MEKNAEKRPAEEHQSLLYDAKAILTEVEGTTTPLSFVKEKLFGYLKEHSKDYLTANFADKDVKDLIDGVRKQAALDVEAGVEGAVKIPAPDAEEAKVVQAVVDSITGHPCKGQMSEPLRKLVSSIWRDGYKKKAIVGELFDDVVPALKELTEQGTRVYVFSSRCSDSQRLLFGYSKDGDLSEMISGYFDATSGPRTEKDTYAKIAKEIELAPADVLYLTCQPTEATAAHAAGMKTIVVVRPGNAKIADKDLETVATISSFSELFGDEGVKVPHKKVCHEQKSPQKQQCHATHAPKEAK